MTAQQYLLSQAEHCRRTAADTRELGRQLHRPTPWVVPEFALRVALGGFADELVDGRRAVPAVLHESGFEFAHRTLPEALAAELR